MASFGLNQTLCANPAQCSAYHELANHMSEMNSKLTSIMSVVQLFFQSWKSSMRPTPPKRPVAVPGAVRPRTRPVYHRVDCLVKKDKPLRAPEKEVSPNLPAASSPNDSVDLAIVKTELPDEDEGQVSEMGEDKMEEETMNEPSTSGAPPPGLIRGGAFQKQRAVPSTPEEFRRHILLFPGADVSVRTLTRFGYLAYFRKKKQITYDQVRTEAEALEKEGLLIKRTTGSMFRKPEPNEPGLGEKLSKYGLTLTHYIWAFNSHPYEDKTKSARHSAAEKLWDVAQFVPPFE